MTAPLDSVGKTVPVIETFTWRYFGFGFFFVSLWVNASEVWRYFWVVMPRVRSELSMVPDVAPMSVPIFFVWGVWDTILVVNALAIYWLFVARFGSGLHVGLTAGLATWVAFFLLFWLGLYNMNLASGETALLALGLSLAELLIAGIIADRVYRWAEKRG